MPTMSNHGHQIAYVFALSLLSISLIVLIIALIFLCRRNPVKCETSCTDTKIVSLTTFPLSDIDSTTDGFSPTRIIGKGRLGTTYVGVLDKDNLVAVKRIHPWLVLSKAGLAFQSTIKSLSSAQHPNIMSIIGLSEAPGERIILTEFVSTMISLDFYLHQNANGPELLDWTRRLRVAAGVARGLEYLHEKMAPQVVHGCIKPSNILVDVEFNPRLCDYGLSFLGSHRDISGLVGYVDEEYFGGGGACKECDVYGFGVVVLELLTGRRNDQGLLVRWALPLIKEMKFSEILDTRIALPSNMKPLVRLAKVASACVGNSRKTRPKISQIVGIMDNLDMTSVYN